MSLFIVVRQLCIVETHGICCVTAVLEWSQLVCMHFGSWDNAKEWSISMPIGEDIQVLTYKSICFLASYI